MKRLVSLLLCVAMLFTAVSCSSTEPIQPSAPQTAAESLTQPFESTISVRYRDIDATAVLSKQSPGSCTVTFQSPATLRDMSMVFTADQVSLSYNQLRASFSPDTIPGAAVSKLLVSAINAAVKDQGVSVDYQDDVLTITGDLEAGSFSLSLDKESGNLLRLSVPEEDFEAEFSGFTILGEQES